MIDWAHALLLPLIYCVFSSFVSLLASFALFFIFIFSVSIVSSHFLSCLIVLSVYLFSPRLLSVFFFFLIHISSILISPLSLLGSALSALLPFSPRWKQSVRDDKDGVNVRWKVGKAEDSDVITSCLDVFCTQREAELSTSAQQIQDGPFGMCFSPCLIAVGISLQWFPYISDALHTAISPNLMNKSYTAHLNVMYLYWLFRVCAST